MTEKTESFHHEGVGCGACEKNGKNNISKKLSISALCTLPFILQMIGSWLGGGDFIPHIIQFFLATVVQFGPGFEFYQSSYRSLRAKSSNMDLLIVLGTSAAYGFSVVVFLFSSDQHLYFETSATIITLVLFGRWLESLTQGRASEALSQLLRLQPKIAYVQKENGFVLVPISEMKRGDIYLVRPGENVPVDGIVIDGKSWVNEAMLSGESLPVVKEEGSKLFAATINQNGSLKAQATQVGLDTVVASIARLVEQAQQSKAPIQRLADKVSDWMVPGVALISLLTCLTWGLFFNDFKEGLINAIAVLVIACPCALGLATPTVIMVSSGLGAGLGILFREASAIEQAEKIQTLIFDKTGTLTQGHPSINRVQPIASYMTELDLVKISASLEQHAHHPIADALVAYAKQQGVTIDSISDFESFPGNGVSGMLQGETYYLGSLRMAEEHKMHTEELINQLREQENQTYCLIWSKEQVLGFVSFSDKIRETSPKAIKKLINMNIHPIMMTGDQPKVAEKIAMEVGIQEFYAAVTPQDKIREVRKLQEMGMCVGVAGDGINDAPALAQSNIGFAIGAGSDIAIEASDITLMRSDLMGVVNAIKLSKATMKKIRQNLFLAFVYNILAIPLAAIGLLNPVIAAAAMALSSVSVISNALLLRSWRDG